jgi:hypothetical protein
MIVVLVFLERKDDPGQEDETVFPATQNIWGFYRAQRAFFTVLFACHSSREVELCGPHTNEN